MTLAGSNVVPFVPPSTTLNFCFQFIISIKNISCALNVIYLLLFMLLFYLVYHVYRIFCIVSIVLYLSFFYVSFVSLVSSSLFYPSSFLLFLCFNIFYQISKPAFLFNCRSLSVPLRLYSKRNYSISHNTSFLTASEIFSSCKA